FLTATFSVSLCLCGEFRPDFVLSFFRVFVAKKLPMKELQTIIQAYREARQRGERCALATVVRVSSSAYRRPGARMLVGEDGRTVGSVSGGCLETDVIRKARQ